MSDTSTDTGKAASEKETADSNGSDPQQSAAETAKPARRFLWLFDLLVFLVLFGAALPIRLHYTTGDLWADEADYAIAGSKGFHANRWDISDRPNDPDRLVRSRHFHPPLTAYVMELGHRYGGPAEESLRVPFVPAGGIVVGLVYLCGVTLFPGRREVGIACAVITLLTPPHIRISSHGVPWSLITLWLMGLLWTLLQYYRTRRWGWIAGAGGVLGAMFVTSEMFLPTVLAAGCAAPFVFWPDFKTKEGRIRVLIGAGVGIALFFLMIGVFWPVGLMGGAAKMLKHYMDLAHEGVPAYVGDRIYNPAPKWAYLYWYWHDYRPYTLCYAAGIAAALILLPVRKVNAAGGALFLYTAVLLAVAHKAHIIGLEYLAHCLPFLALVAGYAFYAVCLLFRPLGIVAAAAVCGFLISWHPKRDMPGIDVRAQLPGRWQQASRFLATKWKPGDRLLEGPQPADVGQWYMLHYARIPASEPDVQQFLPGKPRPEALGRIGRGEYRFVALSSTYGDMSLNNTDVRLYRILKHWPVVWQSDEQGMGASRLIIYEAPANLRKNRPSQTPDIRQLPFPF